MGVCLFGAFQLRMIQLLPALCLGRSLVQIKHLGHSCVFGLVGMVPVATGHSFGQSLPGCFLSSCSGSLASLVAPSDRFVWPLLRVRHCLALPLELGGHLVGALGQRGVTIVKGLGEQGSLALPPALGGLALPLGLTALPFPLHLAASLLPPFWRVFLGG